MTKKFNLNDYIDDIADVSSTSSICPSEDEDYLIPNQSNIEEDEIIDNTLTETTHNTHSEFQRERKQFMDQCIKDDEKAIKSILDKNFKRRKRFSSDSGSDLKMLISKKSIEALSSGTLIKAPLSNINPPKTQFQIGFKRKQALLIQSPSVINTTNTFDASLIASPCSISNNDNDLMILRYSHEKQIKKKLSENSIDFNQLLRERIKEDEIILQNVIKKNSLINNRNSSNKKTLFRHQLNSNKTSSFLHLIKENKLINEEPNNIKKTVFNINQLKH